MNRRLGLFVGLLLLAGCDLNLFGPEVRFHNERPMEPLPEYAEWYVAVELCRGAAGDFDAVRWFVADSISHGGEGVAGFQVGNRITIDADYLGHLTVVRHEVDHHVTDSGNALHLSDGGTACDGYARPTS